MREAGEYLAAGAAHFARIRISVAALLHPPTDPLTSAQAGRGGVGKKRVPRFFCLLLETTWLCVFFLFVPSQGAPCLSFHDFLIASLGSRRELTATGPPAEFYIREGAEWITKGSHLEIMKRSEMPTLTVQGAVGIVVRGWGGVVLFFLIYIFFDVFPRLVCWKHNETRGFPGSRKQTSSFFLCENMCVAVSSFASRDERRNTKAKGHFTGKPTRTTTFTISYGVFFFLIPRNALPSPGLPMRSSPRQLPQPRACCESRYCCFCRRPPQLEIL